MIAGFYTGKRLGLFAVTFLPLEDRMIGEFFGRVGRSLKMMARKLCQNGYLRSLGI